MQLSSLATSEFVNVMQQHLHTYEHIMPPVTKVFFAEALQRLQEISSASSYVPQRYVTPRHNSIDTGAPNDVQS